MRVELRDTKLEAGRKVGAAEAERNRLLDQLKVVVLTLHPAPCTLQIAPYTLHPTPYTLHPTPYTLHPTPYTLHPASCTLQPTP